MQDLKSPYHSVTIGSLTIPGNVFLAPMAGFSDQPYREICSRHGAPFCYTEMVSCEGLAFHSTKTEQLMSAAPSETMHAIQLFTASPDKATSAVQFAIPCSPALIDLNCGCPVPKVIKSGAGAALMRYPDKIGSIVSALREGCDRAGRDIPITVKLRSGWTADEITFIEAAHAAIEAGASAVTLHPRTRSQGYAGEADWELIRQLKASVHVPVIGSGDLYTPRDVGRMMTQTKCDAVMVARGAVGNPFIFERTRRYLTSGTLPVEPTAQQRIDVALEHLRTAIELRGEHRATKELRKHMCAYTKGLPGSAKVRAQVVRAQSYEEFERILRSVAETKADGPDTSPAP